LKLSLKKVLVFKQFNIFLVLNRRIYIATEHRGYLFLSVSLYVGRSIDNLVVVFNVVSCYIEIAIKLEDLCFKLSLVPVVEVGLS
jgi:hypothetical protein